MKDLPPDFASFITKWNAPFYRGDSGPIRRHLWIERRRDGYAAGTHPTGNPGYHEYVTGANKREMAAFLRGMVAGRGER